MGDIKPVVILAEWYFKSNNYSLAIPIIESILLQNRQHSKANELLAYIYGNQGDNNSAIRLLQIACSQTDCSQEALYYLGSLHLKNNSYENAAYFLTKSLQGGEIFFECLHDLATAQAHLGLHHDALKNYLKATSLNDQIPELYFNLGRLYEILHMHQEAIASYEKVAQLDPNFDFILGDIIHAKLLCSSFTDLDQYLAEIKNLLEDLTNLRKLSTPFNFLSMHDSPSLQLKIARVFANFRYPCRTKKYQFSKKQNAKIRLGYFSSDFKDHPIAYLMSEVFDLHDRNFFELYAFSLSASNPKDLVRENLIHKFDKFIHVHDKECDEIVTIARNFNIDIAIDLNGHTKNAKTEIFSERVAPIQINYLGYPGTMGTEYMDYIVADHILIPETDREFYSEKIVYMPNCFQPNDTKRKISKKIFSKSTFNLPDEGFIYCCFNNPHKINTKTFTTWMRILSSVPNSFLWLLASSDCHESNLKMAAKLAGVNPSALIFGARLPVDEYLARYQFADLFLDTLPFNAGTTASDALYAGTPLLTLAGQSFSGRMSASILNASKIPELITYSEAEYEALAIKLALNPPLLSFIKNKLRENISHSPLFDMASYTRNLESAFKDMHLRHLQDLPPKDLEVSQAKFHSDRPQSFPPQKFDNHH